MNGTRPTRSELEGAWLSRIGPQGVWHLRRFVRWKMAVAFTALVFLILLLPAERGGWLGALWAAVTVTYVGLGVAATRHSRSVEKDAAARNGLSVRDSWWIHLDTPEGFDRSILKLRRRREERLNG